MTIDNFYNGILSADSSNFSGLELIIQNCFRALVAQSLGNLDIRASEIKNCSNGLYVLQSGIIQSQFCSFATVASEMNIAYNTITSEGIIYK
ncbi:receptor binding protein [Campylobacter phage PC22]|nr:receptor binding protein [Campylobacter phage PC22]